MLFTFSIWPAFLQKIWIPLPSLLPSFLVRSFLLVVSPSFWGKTVFLPVSLHYWLRLERLPSSSIHPSIQLFLLCSLGSVGFLFFAPEIDRFYFRNRSSSARILSPFAKVVSSSPSSRCSSPSLPADYYFRRFLPLAIYYIYCICVCVCMYVPPFLYFSSDLPSPSFLPSLSLWKPPARGRWRRWKWRWWSWRRRWSSFLLWRLLRWFGELDCCPHLRLELSWELEFSSSC